MTTEDLQEFLLDSGDWVNDPDQGLLCAECAEDGGWEFDENTSTWEHEDVA